MFWMLYAFFWVIPWCLNWTILRTIRRGSNGLTTFSGNCRFLHGGFWESSNRTSGTQTCMLVQICGWHFRHLAPWPRKTDRISEPPQWTPQQDAVYIHVTPVTSHVRRLQVLQSKCLHLATGAPWYVSNRQIQEDLGVPLFADRIRALTVGFDSKLADVGNPLVRQLGRYLSWPRVVPIAWRESQGRKGPAGQ